MFQDIKQVEEWIKGLDLYRGAVGTTRVCAWTIPPEPPGVIRLIMAHVNGVHVWNDWTPGVVPRGTSKVFAPGVLRAIADGYVRVTWQELLNRPGLGWYDARASGGMFWTTLHHMDVRALIARPLGAQTGEWSSYPDLRPSIAVARWFGDETHAQAVLDACTM